MGFCWGVAGDSPVMLWSDGFTIETLTLGARGSVLGWYTANILQGHGLSTHHIPTWVLEIHS